MHLLQTNQFTYDFTDLVLVIANYGLNTVPCYKVVWLCLCDQANPHRTVLPLAYHLVYKGMLQASPSLAYHVPKTNNLKF